MVRELQVYTSSQPESVLASEWSCTLSMPSHFLMHLQSRKHVAMFNSWQNQNYPRFAPVKPLTSREFSLVSCKLASWLKVGIGLVGRCFSICLILPGVLPRTS